MKSKGNFVVRMDVRRDGLSRIRVPIIGHAHCVHPTQVVRNEDINQLYDRVSPGWITAYVTTSFFSESAQREIQTCGYSILLISGKEVAQIVYGKLFANKLTLEEYLDSLEEKYRFNNREPVEIMTE